MRKKMLEKASRGLALSTETVRDIKQSLVALLENCILACGATALHCGEI